MRNTVACLVVASNNTMKGGKVMKVKERKGITFERRIL